jgi:hypothetical protein
MNFVDAMIQLYNGDKVRQKIWAEKRLYIYATMPNRALSEIKWSDNRQPKVNFGLSFFLAHDWEIYTPKLMLSELEMGKKFKFVNGNSFNEFIKVESDTYKFSYMRVYDYFIFGCKDDCEVEVIN